MQNPEIPKILRVMRKSCLKRGAMRLQTVGSERKNLNDFSGLLIGGARGGPVTSSRKTILRFTIHKTDIYVFTILKITERSYKSQKRYVSPIL